MNIDGVRRDRKVHVRQIKTSGPKDTSGFLASLRYPLFILICVAVSDLIALRLQSVSVSMDALVTQLILPAICPGALAIMARLPRYAGISRRWHLIALSNACLSLMLVASFGIAALILQDLAVAYDAPLIDMTLINWDAALGFNWLEIEQWFVAHPAAIFVARMTYPLWSWQLALLTLYFSFTKRHADLAHFLTLFFW